MSTYVYCVHCVCFVSDDVRVVILLPSSLTTPPQGAGAPPARGSHPEECPAAAPDASDCPLGHGVPRGNGQGLLPWR